MVLLYVWGEHSKNRAEWAVVLCNHPPSELWAAVKCVRI